MRTQIREELKKQLKLNPNPKLLPSKTLPPKLLPPKTLPPKLLPPKFIISKLHYAPELSEREFFKLKDNINQQPLEDKLVIYKNINKHIYQTKKDTDICYGICMAGYLFTEIAPKIGFTSELGVCIGGGGIFIGLYGVFHGHQIIKKYKNLF